MSPQSVALKDELSLAQMSYKSDGTPAADRAQMEPKAIDRVPFFASLERACGKRDN
jgi:hypothetical protein